MVNIIKILVTGALKNGTWCYVAVPSYSSITEIFTLHDVCSLKKKKNIYIGAFFPSDLAKMSLFFATLSEAGGLLG